MADRLLFISWTNAVRGREQRALEVFNEAVGLYGRMQQDGRIESFDVAHLDPSPGIAGYIQLHGDAAQLTAVQESEDFQRTLADALLIVEGLHLVQGYANAGVAAQMALFADAIAKVPQHA